MIRVLPRCCLPALVIVLLTIPVSAEKNRNRPSTAPGMSIYEAVEMFNGTWRLQERLNPDGTQHSGLLEGTIVISLLPQRGKLLGVRGFGTLYAEESGLLDRRFGYCCPIEAGDKNFYSESNGTWLVSLESENETEAVLLLNSTIATKGTYDPYEDGLWSKVETRYRLVREETGRPGLPRGPYLQLIKEIRPNEPVAQQNNGSSSSATCCSVGTLFGKGHEMQIEWGEGGQESLEMWMTIKWANGAKDVWKRDPRGCAGYRTCDGILSFPRLGAREYGPAERDR